MREGNSKYTKKTYFSYSILQHLLPVAVLLLVDVVELVHEIVVKLLLVAFKIESFKFVFVHWFCPHA